MMEIGWRDDEVRLKELKKPRLTTNCGWWGEMVMKLLVHTMLFIPITLTLWSYPDRKVRYRDLPNVF